WSAQPPAAAARCAGGAWPAPPLLSWLPRDWRRSPHAAAASRDIANRTCSTTLPAARGRCHSGPPAPAGCARGRASYTSHRLRGLVVSSFLLVEFPVAVEVFFVQVSLVLAADLELVLAREADRPQRGPLLGQLAGLLLQLAPVGGRVDR